MDAADPLPDWNLLRAFLHTARAGSLSAAARELGLAQPTLGRQVAALERQLGVTLFERVGRSLVATPSARALLAHVQRMGESAQALGLAASGLVQAVDGVVSISASDMVAARWLPRVLPALREQAPGLVLELVTTNALSDLQRREADIAIRHVRPQEPELIGVHVRDATAGFYAARHWVQRHGHPRSAADAARHGFVGDRRDGRFLAYLQAHGLPITEAHFTAYAENSVTGWALVRAGMGIGAMMDEVALEDGDMVRVLDEVPPVRFPVWLVTHRELRTARRIRVVFDALAQALARPLDGGPRGPGVST